MPFSRLHTAAVISNQQELYLPALTLHLDHNQSSKGKVSQGPPFTSQMLDVDGW